MKQKIHYVRGPKFGHTASVKKHLTKENERKFWYRIGHPVEYGRKPSTFFCIVVGDFVSLAEILRIYFDLLRLSLCKMKRHIQLILMRFEMNFIVFVRFVVFTFLYFINLVRVNGALQRFGWQ